MMVAIKIGLTVAIVVIVSEIAKRSTFWGAVIASLPLTSLLVFIWVYVETGNTQAVASLSRGIFWLVFASLPFFLLLPFLVGRGLAFWWSLAVAGAVTVAGYFGLVRALQWFGIRF